MNPAQIELNRRKFKKVPDWYVEIAAKLPDEEFAKLGIPMVIKADKSDTYHCNCIIKDRRNKNYICLRCEGYCI